MNELDRAVGEYLTDIEVRCPRLLFALQESPEAVWGEIMKMESACYAFQETASHPAAGRDVPRSAQASAAVREILMLVERLRAQMSRDGLIENGEFAAFRKGVAALRECAHRLRISFAETNRGRGLKVSVFYCSNMFLERGDFPPAGVVLGEKGDSVKSIGLPCSGKVDVPYLVKALETGADAVAIVACKKEECRHFEGSLRAHKRAEAVDSLLKEIGLGAGRVAVIESAQGGARQAGDRINDFIEQVRNLPSPSITSSLHHSCFEQPVA